MILIPKQLVKKNEEGNPFVWVADRSTGRARKATVETGRDRQNGMTEIRSGLDISSRVITSPVDSLKAGQRILITEEAE